MEAVEAVEAPERAHAVLSASSAHRWLHCTPSARLEDTVEDTSSEAAEEGTAAHALAEHKILTQLGKPTPRPASPYEDEVMDEHTEAYAEYVLNHWEEAKAEDPNAVIRVEERLDFSRWVPGGFGTGDCLIAAGGTLIIIDFKYGAGVLVEAENNPQMRLYALGALEALGFLYDFHTVEMHIYQPRRENISIATISVEELRDWGDTTVAPTARIADRGEGEFQPGDWCGFCAVKATCKARADKNLQIARFEFADPHTLDDTQVAEVLALAPQVKKWLKDVEDWALDQAVTHSHTMPGFKLVAGRSVRAFTDPEAVAVAAQNAGYTDIYEKKLITLTKMEKLLGKTQFASVLGDLVHKPEGKPTLVPVDDPRPEMVGRSAVDDFTN